VRKVLLGILVLTMIWSCSNIKFNTIALYDVYEKTADQKETEQIIYEDELGTMWSSLENCGSFDLSEESSFSGRKSIKIEWAKSGCEWIGFGNSFNNWNPEDLSEKIKSKALSLKVRTIQGVASNLPIVANLEDYEGGGVYYFIGQQQYLNTLKIDTSWSEIVVPLWHFPYDEEALNYRKIKQMKFQLESQGSFLIDDIKIIDYSVKEFEKLQKIRKSNLPAGEKKQEIYPVEDFGFAVWGQNNKDCQLLKEVKDSAASTFIRWEITDEKCSNKRWGINWSNWHALNLSGLDSNSRLQLSVDVKKTTDLSIFISDFNGSSIELFNGIIPTTTNEGKLLTLPIGHLLMNNETFQANRVKELSFEANSSGLIHFNKINLK
jgi:hypothetical protein